MYTSQVNGFYLRAHEKNFHTYAKKLSSLAIKKSMVRKQFAYTRCAKNIFYFYLDQTTRPVVFKERKKKLYFNNLLHIHQHTFLRYMIQSVIEGNIRRQICLYTIFPYIKGHAL